jgi:hypothetical protein
MHKMRRGAIFLAILLVAAPLLGGVCLAQTQNNYSLQYITSATGFNYLDYLQGISGIYLPNFFSDKSQVDISFSNFNVNGIYNSNIGVGSFRNQGSVAFVNIEPELNVAPVTVSGHTFSQGNQVTIGGYNYTVNLDFSGLKGTGLFIINGMAGSFSNQFSSLTLNMGKNAIPTLPLNNVMDVSNPAVVSLTNQQMQLVAATGDNAFVIRGDQAPPTTNMTGAPNIHGISVITLSAGVNNQAIHNVGVNIDTK